MAMSQQLHPHAEGTEAALACPGTDASGHLLLNQQHQALIRRIDRSIEAPNQALQQWASDVVRNIGDNLGGSPIWITQLRQSQHIAALQLETTLTLKPMVQAVHEIAIQLDRLY